MRAPFSPARPGLTKVPMARSDGLAAQVVHKQTHNRRMRARMPQPLPELEVGGEKGWQLYRDQFNVARFSWLE